MLTQLEGPDCAGKSTLAGNLLRTWRNISPDHQAILVHTGPPGNWDQDEMSIDQWRKYCFLRLKAVIDMVEPHDYRTLLVMDRGTWGSPVYGKLFRPRVDHDGFGDLGKTAFMALEQLISDKGGITAHISPPLETVITRALARAEGEDEFLDEQTGTRKQQITNIYDGYYDFIRDNERELVSYAGSGVFTSAKLISKLPGYEDFTSADAATDKATDTTGNNNG